MREVRDDAGHDGTDSGSSPISVGFYRRPTVKYQARLRVGPTVQTSPVRGVKERRILAGDEKAVLPLKLAVSDKEAGVFALSRAMPSNRGIVSDMNDGVVAKSKSVDLETGLLIGGGESSRAANVRRPHALGKRGPCRGSHAVRPCVDHNLPTFG